ncbi:hypothetical protein AVEN_245826-1 [Araneus ventricosus]|uniref:Reverse transcriptase zinc-binding domain-containing protein n=1 Tax=Araneus ventricosus TaxID=182803 RepID=A0A4Y2EAV0_ARAVE|nr:hypothetical protein AVEN_245826-1 [Araneus ventricosus]
MSETSVTVRFPFIGPRLTLGLQVTKQRTEWQKKASEKSIVDIQLGFPERSFRTALRKLINSVWKTRWDYDGNGRFTYNVFKEVKSSRCIDSIYITQLVTNHGLCLHYLKRFNLKNYNCRCDEDTQDGIYHFISICPLTSQYRKFIKYNTPVSQILSDKRFAVEVKANASTTLN